MAAKNLDCQCSAEKIAPMLLSLIGLRVVYCRRGPGKLVGRRLTEQLRLAHGVLQASERSPLCRLGPLTTRIISLKREQSCSCP